MKNVLCMYKPLGKTPLDVIASLRAQKAEYATAKLGYAGRLDPMAEGLLLILVNEENKERKKYERYPKTYQFEILFGVSTDTYDVLGKITNHVPTQEIDEKQLQQILSQYIGKQMQAYPPYSSPRVNGKPLFYWARNNKLHEITIPQKQIEIYNVRCKKVKVIQRTNLEKLIFKKLQTVSGNFRQEEIREIWKDFFATVAETTYSIAEMEVSCSSGTYVRSLAHQIGQKLETGGIALSIIRTTIGPYSLS